MYTLLKSQRSHRPLQQKRSQLNLAQKLHNYCGTLNRQTHKRIVR